MSVTSKEMRERIQTICFSGLAIKEGLTPAALIKELKRLAFSDMKDFVQIDEQGSTKPLSIDSIKDKSKCIKKIRERRRILQAAGKSEDIILEDTFEFELYDKLNAIDIAMNLHGMKKPQKVEHSGSVSILGDALAKARERANAVRDNRKTNKK